MKECTMQKVSSCPELQELFRRAQSEKQAVYLYRSPQPGGIGLDFSDWKDIEVFDLDNLMVIVPPGLKLGELNEIAQAKGLRFLPGDTPFYQDLTVGEWAYRGCPNPSAWKYGAGKHFLLGATYLFPNGDLTPVGGQCIKNVTGYDFTRFLTGAYADLAVGVRYIMKLMPQPAFRRRFDLTVETLADAVSIVSSLQSRSVPPAWLFWADEAAGEALFKEPQKGHRIILELDGNETEVRAYGEALEQIIGCAVLRQEPGHIPDLSHIEKDPSDFWLLDEFKVPYGKATAFAASFETKLSQQGLSGGLFGHLGDGKIHLYLKQTGATEAADIVAAMTAEAAAAGGAGSGKYRRLYGTQGASPLDNIEQSFKQRFDPGLIFNRKEACQ